MIDLYRHEQLQMENNPSLTNDQVLINDLSYIIIILCLLLCMLITPLNNDLRTPTRLCTACFRDPSLKTIPGIITPTT